MRKITLVGALGALLAGCAGVYSESAFPGAQAAYSLAIERCDQAKHANLEEAMGCVLAADRQFAVDIKLRRMDLFDTYAQRMAVLKEDANTGRAGPDAFKTRYVAIRTDFYRSIDQAAAIDAAQRARTSAALAGMGQAMQNAGYAYQASQPVYTPLPAPPPQINCRTINLGGGMSRTQCN